MKVVLIGPYPEPGAAISGGVERVIDALVPQLAQYVDLALVVPGATRDARTELHGVPVHYLKRGPGPGVLSSWTFDAARVGELVQSLKPDLVHLQAGGGVGRTLSVPRIMTVHGIAHQDLLRSTRGRAWGVAAKRAAASLIQQVERNARADLRGVIVINPYVREALPDLAALRQWDIPNPLDAHFARMPPPSIPRARRIIAVGRITPRKEVKRIIKIGLGVMEKDAEVELVVCGSAQPQEYGEACQDLARTHPAGERVRFCGNLGTRALIGEMDQASVLLMASLQETAPMAIAEANSRGVAVVAPEAFGIRHMISPGRNGTFLPPGDISLQAAAVRSALDFDWDRSGIAAQAVEKYSADRIAAATVAAYRDVMASLQR